MKILIQPQKGSSYKLLFYDGRHIIGAGFAELTETPRGPRPTKYRLRWGGKKEYRHTPSKDLISQLREADVRLTKSDVNFETFLSDFQIKTGTVDACRMCLLDERYTPLTEENCVTFGKGEKICLECGKRELRREVSHIGRLGLEGIAHLENLLDTFRDLDRVLSTLQPDKLTMKAALYDRLEPHPVMTTASIDELPLPRQFIEASGVSQLDAGPAACGGSGTAARQRYAGRRRNSKR